MKSLLQMIYNNMVLEVIKTLSIKKSIIQMLLHQTVVRKLDGLALSTLVFLILPWGGGELS